MLLSSFRQGFLLIECMIGFVVLSLSILICLHSFLSVVRDYRQAKERLKLLDQTQHMIEYFWIHNDNQRVPLCDKIVITKEVIEDGIILPSVPNLSQVWIEIASPVSKRRMLKIRSMIKEE